jgi:PAS domain S-box-containing protein
MTDGPIVRRSLADEYAAALEDCVSGAGETALTRAYDLGRRAAAEGIGVVEMALVHHEALQQVLSRTHLPEPAILLAGQFFAESVSPFEMTLRAYQANARLLGLSETLSAQNTEIDRARRQLRNILDATTAVIYLKDVDGVYLFVNEQFQMVFDRMREDVIGKRAEQVLPPPVFDALHGSDEGVLEARKPQELEDTLPLSDGAHTYLSLKFPLLDADGASYAICCVATDITERKRAAEALRKAKEAADTANQDLEAFSYSVAHDLRAPLRSIDGFSLALLEDHAGALDDPGRKYLHRVRASAQHMAHLIDDLLMLSRLTRTDFHCAPVDLTATCLDIAEQLRATDTSRRVEFVFQPGVWATGDSRLLRIVLDNLLGNAWKFTGRRAAARIEFGTQRDSPPVVYFVRDNGAGFDMVYAEKLFGVFQRLHRADEFEGTGIGLATVHRIIRRHGGHVWAEGVVDCGATFYFTLEEEASAQ